MSRAKRAVDLVASVGGLIIIWPLLVAIAATVRRDGGPAFYRQERVGRRGRPFRMWKFRTMVPNADRIGPLLTAEGDPRVTRIGAWLRRLKLDELPQLFNVVSGEMSLVGPRPEVPRYVARYTADESPVLELTPGITDPASVVFYNEAALLAGAGPDFDRLYVEEILPAKIRLNLEYANRATVVTDIRLVLQTLGVIASALRGQPVLHNPSAAAQNR